MVFSPRQMWWLNLALVAIVMLSMTGWAALDVPPKFVAWINAMCTFSIGVLHFVIQGTIPGAGMSARADAVVPGLKPPDGGNK
jgi:hypothetical protein